MKGSSSSLLKPTFEIESVDKNGRPSFRQILDFNNLDEIYDTSNKQQQLKSSSFCSLKRKSDLSDQLLKRKSRITINAFNQRGSIVIQPPHQQVNEDPFSQGPIHANNDPFVGEGRQSQSFVRQQHLNIGRTTLQRISRISQIIMDQSAMLSSSKNPNFSQIEEEIEDEDLFSCGPTDETEFVRKMSIRSINTNQHVLHLKLPFNHQTILARASTILMNRQRTSQLDDQGFNNVDADDIDDEPGKEASAHRCSMVKKYFMPTFFTTPEKQLSSKLLKTPSPTLNKKIIEQLEGQQQQYQTQKIEFQRLEEIPESTVLLKKQSSDQSEQTVLNVLSYSNSQVQDVQIGQQSLASSIIIDNQQVKKQNQQPYSFLEYNLERISNLQSDNQPLVTEEVKVSIIPDSIQGSNLLPYVPPLEKDSLDRRSSDMADSLDQEQPFQQNGKLEGLVTKVDDAKSADTTADLHKQHFYTTLQSLEHIRSTFSQQPSLELLSESLGGLVQLPEPWDPTNQKKVAIFDMDETLIHCVDDVEQDNPDVILEIDFSADGQGQNPEDIVCAGINIRPYWQECLEEASKNFQVVVFTASHQTYADAILNYLDPENKFIQYRLYRHHCYQTPENYYVKDLRVIANRDLSEMVLIDNSVYSFAYQLSNGVPIVPFYREPPKDEEMLHLIYYLSCLAQVPDVRVQNMQAFELHKLAGTETQAPVQQQYGVIQEEEEEDEEPFSDSNQPE